MHVCLYPKTKRINSTWFITQTKVQKSGLTLNYKALLKLYEINICEFLQGNYVNIGKRYVLHR